MRENSQTEVSSTSLSFNKASSNQLFLKERMNSFGWKIQGESGTRYKDVFDTKYKGELGGGHGVKYPPLRSNTSTEDTQPGFTCSVHCVCPTKCKSFEWIRGSWVGLT